MDHCILHPAENFALYQRDSEKIRNWEHIGKDDDLWPWERPRLFRVEIVSVDLFRPGLVRMLSREEGGSEAVKCPGVAVCSYCRLHRGVSRNRSASGY